MNDELKPKSQNISNPEPPSGAFARGASGCFLGAIAGPCLFFLGLYIMAWLFPNEEAGGWLLMFAAFILSIPGGAVAGAVLAIKAPAIIRFIKRRLNR